MSTKYKVPHKASFLQKFHSAAQGFPADLDGENDYLTPAEYDLAAAEDLLNEVPVEAPAYMPTDRQKDFISDLIGEISKSDAGAALSAVHYTQAMTTNGRWTPGSTGTVSTWIDRLIAKRDALRAAAPAPSSPSVPDGRYAVEVDGTLKFYRLKNGRKPGFVFLDVQASGDFHPIRSAVTRTTVIALIAADPRAAMIRYGRELGVCGHCGRTLTDEASRTAGIGPVCAKIG